MKIKGLILLTIFLSFAALSLSQSQIASAQTVGATTPITYFTYHLRGQISYRLFKWLYPASNVIVSAKDLNTGETFHTKTNLTGTYILSVKQATDSAEYIIKPNDGQKTKWTPPQYQLTVSKDINKLHFVGTR